MEKVTKVYVGVDVSKKRLDVYLNPVNQAFFVDNTEHGIKQLLAKLAVYDVEQVVCESSGGYEDRMLKALQSAGYKTWQVEPTRINFFIRSEGKRAKTDAIDARMIAMFAAQKTSAYVQPLRSEKQEEFRDLAKRRKDLVEMITTEKLRLKGTLSGTYKKDVQAHVAFMQKRLEKIDAEIRKHIDSDDDLSNKAKILDSVPGVGEATITMLLAEVPELGQIGDKQIAALVGVAPYTRESGTFKGSASIVGGRISVRKGLYMSALVASRCNPPLKEFYKRLCKAGKKPKVALIAVMRKLIVILNVMLRNGSVWRHSEA